MKAIKQIFLQNLRQFFRDRYALFWSLAFPLVLMAILILIFSGGDGDQVTFRISLVNRAEVSEGMDGRGLFMNDEEEI